jgi:hypothetical protein
MDSISNLVETLQGEYVSNVPSLPFIGQELYRPDQTGTDPDPGTAIAITTSTLQAEMEDVDYSFTFTASGGSGGYVWALASGALPAGLTLSPSGVLSGIPSNPGTSNFSIKVTDSANATISKTFTLTINATGTPGQFGALVIMDEDSLNEKWDLAVVKKVPEYVNARNKQIALSSLSWPGWRTQNVTLNIDTPPSGNKRDYLSYAIYWWPLTKHFDLGGGEWGWQDGPPAANGSGWKTGSYSESINWTATGNVKESLDYNRNSSNKRDKSLPQKGEPYFNRDGRHNQHTSDLAPAASWFRNMQMNIRTLGLSYFFSKTTIDGLGNEAYVDKGIDILRGWVIKPEPGSGLADVTMNPHLLYSGVIKGRTARRAECFIDFEYMGRMLDGIYLLSKSSRFTDWHKQSITQWFNAYATWATTEWTAAQLPVGNIRIAYELQVVAGYVFGDNHLAAYNRMESQFFKNGGLLADYIRTDGYFTHERGRTDSWGYSVKIIYLLFELAEINAKIIPPSGKPKRDLFNFIDKGNDKFGFGDRGLRMMFNKHYAYASGGSWGEASASTRRSLLRNGVMWASYIWKTNEYWDKYLKYYHNDWLLATPSNDDRKWGLEMMMQPYFHAATPKLNPDPAANKPSYID